MLLLNDEFLRLQQAVAGRYSLEREVGRGGMGVVYLAREVRLDRPVALKLLPAQFATRRDLRERFLREARTAARLSHPHIVPIHAVDEVGDFVFMVMAYVEGQTLEQRLLQRGPLPVSEAARVLREVAWALAYAHSQGIVHRDIKPANILLEAGSQRALVSDFGIAHIKDQSSPAGFAEIIGTAEYMSPEQAAGGVVDGRSDLYALGIVGYFILSGRLPFSGPTLSATLAKQLTTPAVPLASVAPEVPLPVAQAIDRCLAKHPDARFADGKQFADAMGNALERRTQVPIALRTFTEQVIGTLPVMLVLEVVASAFLFLGFTVGNAPVAGFRISASIFGMLLAVAPFGILTVIARRLIRAGYRHDELVRALRQEVEDRREAFAHERSIEPSPSERLAARFAVGGLIVSACNSLYMMFGPYFPVWETLINPVALALGASSLVAGLYSATKHSMRTGRVAERWVALWDNRAARALFKLAGVKLEHTVAVGASYRPTELAIGLAADRLFAELPAEMRQSLPDLPVLVRTLERHAEKLRQRIAELDGIRNDIQQTHSAQLAGVQPFGEQRSGLNEDVCAARDGAERRLVEVVAALENIRLELLRLHAAVGTVSGVTSDLSSARELSADVERLFDASREISDLLDSPKGRSIGDTPVPAG